MNSSETLISKARKVLLDQIFGFHPQRLEQYDVRQRRHNIDESGYAIEDTDRRCAKLFYATWRRTIRH